MNYKAIAKHILFEKSTAGFYISTKEVEDTYEGGERRITEFQLRKIMQAMSEEWIAWHDRLVEEDVMHDGGLFNRGDKNA